MTRACRNRGGGSAFKRGTFSVKTKGRTFKPKYVTKGKRKGQRSIRLNRAYRAFYVVSKGAAEFVSVEEVNKHEY